MKYRSTTQPNVEFWAEEQTYPDGRKFWAVLAQAKGYPAHEAHDDHFVDGQAADDVARELAGHPARIPAGHNNEDVIPTKDDEIRRLKVFAAAQHPNSYLGSWMKYLIPCVEQDLRSDIDTVDTPHTLREIVKQQLSSAVRREIEHAYKELEEVKRQIVREKEQLGKVQAEHAMLGRFRDQASRQLQRALKNLED